MALVVISAAEDYSKATELKEDKSIDIDPSWGVL
jgi:hypothetical protein